MQKKLLSRLVGRGPVRIRRYVLPLALLAAAAAPWSPSQAFTQSGVGLGFFNGIPMGHEWLTRLSVMELIGNDPIMPPDPADPRRRWRRGLAKNTDLSSPTAQAELRRLRSLAYPDQRYQSTYQFVFDAILGERWVDIGGFNVTKGHLSKVDCWDAVAQEPAEIQYDHFMRRYDDAGGDGGVRAAQQSTERFMQYFVNAAMAPEMQIRVWDGGGYSTAYNVDHNYYLLGRAAHLLQDSFSTEHTVRDPDTNLEVLRQVKSYLCAEGSEQHTHDNKELLTYASGDVIWIPGTQFDGTWSGYRPSNMKVPALVALEASKDLWAAFIRTMGEPMATREARAKREALTLAQNWLSFDPNTVRTWYDDPGHRDASYVLNAGQTGKGRSQQDCMRGLGQPSGSQSERVAQLQADQRLCLFNLNAEEGYADLFDPSTHMPFYWAWTGSNWNQPPSNWRIPTQAAASSNRVRIRSAFNQQLMTAPEGVVDNAWIYNRPGAPIDFMQVGNNSSSYFRSAVNPELFLSYRELTGAVKLESTPLDAAFEITNAANNSRALRNLRWNNYMWLYNESPYITKDGNPANTNARWTLEPVMPR